MPRRARPTTSAMRFWPKSAGSRPRLEPFRLKRDWGSSACAGRGAKPDDSERTKRNEGHQHHKLRDDEWRLRLRRRQWLQERQLLERLNDADKDIQIERRHSGDDVDPAPGTGKME